MPAAERAIYVPINMDTEVGGAGSPGASDVYYTGYITSLPVPPEISAPFAYFFMFLTGILLLIFERKNDYVRFHAWQSTLLSIVFLVMRILLNWSPLLLFVLSFSYTVLSLFLMYKASIHAVDLQVYRGIPYVGDLAHRLTYDQ